MFAIVVIGLMFIFSIVVEQDIEPLAEKVLGKVGHIERGAG